MTFNANINGSYLLHRDSGRWVQSLLEMDVAHLLHRTKTPFCSGLDAPCTVNIPSKNRRSDDFVIPVRSNYPLADDLHLVEHHLEIMGMAAVHEGDRLEKYLADKMQVHDHFESDPDVMHHLLPPPKNRGKYTEAELRAYIGHILGVTHEMAADHDQRNLQAVADLTDGFIEQLDCGSWRYRAIVDIAGDDNDIDGQLLNLATDLRCDKLLVFEQGLIIELTAEMPVRGMDNAHNKPEILGNESPLYLS